MTVWQRLKKPIQKIDISYTKRHNFGNIISIIAFNNKVLWNQDGGRVKKYSKRLKTMQDLRRYLASQINQLDQNAIDENRLRCVAYALATLASIIRDGDLEARLTALEKAAEVKRA